MSSYAPRLSGATVACAVRWLTLRLSGRPIRLLIELTLFIGVLGTGLGVFRAAAEAVPFHNDENAYIRAGRYFSYLFIRHDIRRREWGDNRTTHTQGLVPSYIIGPWLWARGRPIEDLSVRLPEAALEPWQRDLPAREQIDRQFLEEARQPMVVVGAAAIAALYLLGRLLGGRLAGLAAAALALASPPVQNFLSQARSEPPLMLFVLLALLLAVAGARRHGGGRLPLGWALATGAALGLAIGSKHTAVLSLIALLAWGLLAAVLGIRPKHPAGLGARVRSSCAAGWGWWLAAAVGFVVFVLSNPHFYPDPPRHLAHLVEARQEVTLDHMQDRPEMAVHSLPERVGLVLGRALVDDTATGSRGVPLEAILVPLGAVVLLRNTLRAGKQTGHLPADGLVLLTVATYFIVVTATLYVTWGRYFLPTLLLGVLLSGIGLATVLRWLPTFWVDLRSRRPGAWCKMLRQKRTMLPARD